jgi:glycine hydroxymethyltransferase
MSYPINELSDATLIYASTLRSVARVSKLTALKIIEELEVQRSSLKLIASENYSSIGCQAAMANLLTDKYAEGVPFRRYYSGCAQVDSIEDDAREKAKKLFAADHAYVQPHSGADANLIAFWAILHEYVGKRYLGTVGRKSILDASAAELAELRKLFGNQRLLAMDYACGGHLTHGYRMNVSAQMFEAHSYEVRRDTGLLDYDAISEKAREIRPLILLAGYSSYPRKINFRVMREIADSVGAVLMVDMAHFAGLVAGGVFENDFNPIPFADIVTTTTHKTLRGPRGGLILCKSHLKSMVDKGCPLVMGGPLPHVIAAKAVAFTEALHPSFSTYAKQIVENAKALANRCLENGLQVATQGTDNHMVIVDVRNFSITGKQAEDAMRSCGIALNRNSIPFDPERPEFTSGLRLGTPALTTLGMKEREMNEVADIVAQVLRGTQRGYDDVPKKTDVTKPDSGDTATLERILSKKVHILDPQTKVDCQEKVNQLLARFQLYPTLDLNVVRNLVESVSENASAE